MGLQRQGPYLSLTVPGLAEGRPSLLVGDRAILCDEGERLGLLVGGKVDWTVISLIHS